MKVEDLIEKLKEFDQEMPVAFDRIMVEVKLVEWEGHLVILPEGKAVLAKRFGPGRSDETDVHTEHCCWFCGCKYHDSECTVARGILKQSFEHLQTSVCYDMKPGYYDNW